jgi:hypothetical protein
VKDPLWSADVDVAAGKTARATLAYRPGTENLPRVVGFLVDEAGRPVLHARVGACAKRKDAEFYRKGYYAADRGDTWTQVDGRFEIVMSSDRGIRAGLRAWEPSDPAGAGQVRIVATLAEYYTKNMYDVTRDWPKEGNTLDVGRITVRIPAEMEVAVRGERPGSKRLDLEVQSCTDQAGRNVLYRLNYLHPQWNPNSVGPDIRIVARCEGIMNLRLGDELGNVADLRVPAEARNSKEPLTVRFPAARKVVLTVLDEAGKSIKGVRLVGRPTGRPADAPWKFPPGGIAGDISDETGELAFELAPQANGTYMLYKELGLQPFSAELPAGAEPLRQTIRMRPSDASVAGRILVPAGQTVISRSAVVFGVVKNADGGMPGIPLELDHDGRFSAAVPSGVAFHVYAMATTNDHGLLFAHSASVTLKPGQKANLDVVVGRDQPGGGGSPPPPAPAGPEVF